MSDHWICSLKDSNIITCPKGEWDNLCETNFFFKVKEIIELNALNLEREFCSF